VELPRFRALECSVSRSALSEPATWLRTQNTPNRGVWIEIGSGTRPAKIRHDWELTMIVVGLILLLLGLLLGSAVLWTVGIVVLLVGAVLWLLGAAGRPLAGRRHYW
jgi:hypothetical protein